MCDQLLIRIQNTYTFLYGAVFVVGSIGLRYYPKRPGLFRRRVMLGTACGGLWASWYQHARLNDKIDFAFDVDGGDTPEKRFWRHVAFIVRVPSLSASLRQVNEKAISSANPIALKSNLSAFREAEWHFLKSLPGKLHLCASICLDQLIHIMYIGWYDSTCCLLSTQMCRLIWCLLIEGMADLGKIKKLDNPHDIIRVPAYFSLLSHTVHHAKVC